LRRQVVPRLLGRTRALLRAPRTVHLTPCSRGARALCCRLRSRGGPMRCVLTCVLSAYVSLAALPAQGRRGPVPTPAAFAFDPALQDPTNLVVKFVEGSGVRRRGGAFVGAAGFDLRPVDALVAKAVLVERLFLRGEEQLDGERARLLARLAPAVVAAI